MGLSALDIYKLLPRTNCRRCGFATCLIFAMKILQKAVDLSLCPDLSEEARRKLIAISKPPIQLVTIGADKHRVEVGNETVLFRHEETFYHPPAIFLRIKSSLPPDEVSRLVREISSYKVIRMGEELKLDGFAVEDSNAEPSGFVRLVEQVMAESPLPLILISTNPQSMGAALERACQRRPLIYGADKQNWAEMADLSLKYGCPLTVIEREGSLDRLSHLTEQVRRGGVEEIVLDPGGRGFSSSLGLLTQIRRLAIKKNFSPLGYPVITFPGEGVDEDQEVLAAAQHIAKYAGLIVLNHFRPEALYPLLVLRQNIYTNPQKPIQVKPGLYPINSPKRGSPLCVTTNFSLTYFTVSGELESSGFPCWLLVCDTEGLSVLTAWAAGKFDGHKIASSVKSSNLYEVISHRSLIIPGLVAVLRGEIEEELSGWRVLVGPKEAINLASFLRKHWRFDNP